MDNLRRRLLRVEQDFLSAFDDGDEAMAAFEESWSALVAEIGPLACDDETQHLMQTVAANLTILAESLLDLDQEYDAMRSSLNTEVLEIFESMNLTESDKSYPECCPSQKRPRDSEFEPPHPIPPYIDVAYRWLLKNLHNPYPSLAVKREMAGSSKTSLNTIDKWFHRCRNKIGWNRIRVEFFDDDREAIVRTARRAFFEDDPLDPLPPDVFLRFIQMRHDADELYEHKLNQSRLSITLGAFLQNMTTEEVAEMEESRMAKIVEQRKQKAEEREARRRQRRLERQIAKRKAIQSYPSPDRSLHGSPAQSHASLPSVGDVSDLEHETPPSSVGCKRRRLSFSDSSQDDELDTASKRHRPNHSEPQLTQTYVPLTPQSCAGDLREETPDRVEEWTNAVCEAITKPPHLSLLLSTPRASPLLPTPSPPATPAPFIHVVCGASRELSPLSPLDRKRRLSDSEFGPPPPPKRLRALPSDPCPCDIPNTPPISDDDWSSCLQHSGQHNLPNVSCIHDGTTNSSETRSIGCIDLKSFVGDSEGIVKTSELTCPNVIPEWEGKSSGEENLNLPIPMPPKKETPQATTVCPFLLSGYNALDLRVDSPDPQSDVEPLSKIRLWSLTQPNTLCQLKTFDVLAETAAATVRSPNESEYPPHPPLSRSVRWLANLRDHHSQKEFFIPVVLPFERLGLSHRALMGIGYVALSCHEKRTKLSQLRAQETEIARLKQSIN